MTAMQLDWKFGSEGLDAIGESPIYVYVNGFANAFLTYADVALEKSQPFVFAWAKVPMPSVDEIGRAKALIASSQYPST